MDLLERAAAHLRKAPDVAVGYAFGSVPEGRAHAESDLDLAVLLDWKRHPDRSSRFARQIELISELIGATGRNEIDVVILNDAPPLFARRILYEGVLLHSADRETLHALTRDVQLRAADIEPFIRKHRARLLEELRG